MALGSTDELSSTLGLAREYCDEMVLNNSAGLDETKRKGIIERLVKVFHIYDHYTLYLMVSLTFYYFRSNAYCKISDRI